MEFEIKLGYTIEDFEAYWRGFIWKKPNSPVQKTASARQMMILGLVILAGALLTFAMLHEPLTGILELIVGVLLLVSGFRTARPGTQSGSRWVKQMWKAYQASGQFYNCCFTGDGCWVHDSKSDHRYDYDALEALWEDPERFYMVIPGNRFYILRKNAFVQGTPEEFSAFWKDRTGKPVRQVQ